MTTVRSVPTVTVIIPCYRQAHFLPVTLASVQSQEMEDWECLIIDDGSPDDTEDVARRWIDADDRFRYFRKENGGLSSARNWGLSRAQGRYIQFLDSDDVLLPNKLKLQLRQLDGCPLHSLAFCDYTHGNGDDIYAPLNVPAPYLPPVLNEVTSIYELAADWETRLSIPAHCFLFNRIFFDEGITFDEGLANHEDWDCWMRIFSMVQEIKYSSEKLVIYRYRSGSMCHNLSGMKIGFLQAIDKQLLNEDLSREVRAVLRAKRAETCLNYDWKLLQRPSVNEQKPSLVQQVVRRLLPGRKES